MSPSRALEIALYEPPFRHEWKVVPVILAGAAGVAILGAGLFAAAETEEARALAAMSPLLLGPFAVVACVVAGRRAARAELGRRSTPFRLEIGERISLSSGGRELLGAPWGEVEATPLCLVRPRAVGAGRGASPLVTHAAIELRIGGEALTLIRDDRALDAEEDLAFGAEVRSVGLLTGGRGWLDFAVPAADFAALRDALGLGPGR